MVAVGQALLILSSVVTGFFVPILLGVTEFGFYKIYTLYFTYTSLLHFGFVDGILLKYAGKNYFDLDKEVFRGYFRFFLLFQLLIGGILCLSGILFDNRSYLVICLFLGINMVVTNITTYFQFISQATKRFKEFSKRNIIIACYKIIAIVFLGILRKYSVDISFTNYLVAMLIIDLSMLIWYICKYHDIVFGIRKEFRFIKDDLLSIFKKGIILTVAFQTGHLILCLDRQFVSLLFDVETFAQYSFAYSLVTMFVTIISAFAVVLFPMLKSYAIQESLHLYDKIMSSVICVATICLVGYTPISLLIKHFLPDYANSIQYLSYIFPALVLVSIITIVEFTIFKVLDKILNYFIISMCILGISIILNYVLFKIYGNPISISVASIISLLIWHCSLSIFLQRKFNLSYIKHTCYVICIIILFYVITMIVHESIAQFILLLCSFLIIQFAFYKSLIMEMLTISLNKKKNR